MTQIKQFLEENKVSPEVRQNLEKYHFNFIESIHKHSDDLVVVVSKFNDLSSAGGVARDSILTVFYKDKAEEQKWRYSDKWSYKNDRWDLMLREVQKVTVEDQGTETVIIVECLGAVDYPNRVIKFLFSN